jgi:hypothetical protein
MLCWSQEHTKPPRSEPTPVRTEPPSIRPVPAASTRTEPAAGSWIRHESPAGRYRVLLPVEPTLSSQEAATADGVKFTQYLSNATSQTAVCLTGYFDQVPGTVFNFDQARDGMLSAIKGTLLWEKSISLDGHNGREFQIAAHLEATQMVFRVRIYHVQTRVYILQFISEKRFESPEIVRDSVKYFDSFTPYMAP